MDINLANLLNPLLSIGIRVSGLMMFAPFFGSTAIPVRIKAVLVITITAVLYPALAARVVRVQITNWPYLVFHELIIGIALGIAANLVFDAVQMAGQILSVQMGYSLVNILDPQTKVESTVVALFHQTIAMLIFLGLNVHHYLLRAITNSFDYLPVGTVHIRPAFATAALKIGGSIFAVGLQIAAPVLAATLLADIVIGLLGKASPQMPLLLLGPAIKSMLGVAVLMGVIKYWPSLLERWFFDSFAYADHLLHLAR